MPFPDIDGYTFAQDQATVAEWLDRIAPARPPEVAMAFARLYQRADLVSTNLYDVVEYLQAWAAKKDPNFVPIDLQSDRIHAARSLSEAQPHYPFKGHAEVSTDHPHADGQQMNIVAPAIPGVRGFDSDTIITPARATALHSVGFRFAIRYLSRTTPQNTGDLSSTETWAILDAGMALMAVQHVQKAGWTPSAGRGSTYGMAAVQNASECGILPGVNLWLDLEGLGPWATEAATIGYCNAWADRVSAGGFVPGLYVGANQPLSGTQLYRDLVFEHYWKSASNVPEDIPVRGYQMIQMLMPNPISGFGIDGDIIATDALGSLPLWMDAAPDQGASGT